MVPIALPCTSVAMTASLYTVLALAVERFLTVSASSQRNKVGQSDFVDGFVFHPIFQGALLGYILPVSIFSAFYNLPKFFEYTTQYMDTDRYTLIKSLI